MPTPRTGSWKSLDAWLTPRFTIAPVADSDSDSCLNGDNRHARTSHTHAHNGNTHGSHSRSYATSTDTQRAAVGLSDHKPATGGLLAVS